MWSILRHITCIFMSLCEIFRVRNDSERLKKITERSPRQISPAEHYYNGCGSEWSNRADFRIFDNLWEVVSRLVGGVGWQMSTLGLSTRRENSFPGVFKSQNGSWDTSNRRRSWSNFTKSDLHHPTLAATRFMTIWFFQIVDKPLSLKTPLSLNHYRGLPKKLKSEFRNNFW